MSNVKFKIHIRGADKREAALLAHQSTFGRIIMENASLRALFNSPRPFFTDAIKGVRGREQRALSMQSLMTWVHWGELIARTMHAGTPDEKLQKRMLRAKRCSPAGVILPADYYYRCENYICPMCWYRHVRDRLKSVRQIMSEQSLGRAVHVQGLLGELCEAIPSKEDHAHVYDLAARLRNDCGPSGSLTAVRLLGQPKRWQLAADMILLGASTKDIRARSEGYDDAEWTISPIQVPEASQRGRQLLLKLASCVEYPMGIFHKGMYSLELQQLFMGRRLVRSRTTGSLSAPLN